MMERKLPKLYRSVYIPVWFECPRLVCGEYDPSISIEYYRARVCLSADGEKIWRFIDNPPTEEECKCMVDYDFNDWKESHPDRYIPNLTRQAYPSLREQRKAKAEWNLFGLPF